jgi:hypothetical protein
MVPVDQLDKVMALVDASHIPCWVNKEAISLNGKPEVTVNNLDHRSDPVMVQRLVDSIP